MNRRVILVPIFLVFFATIAQSQKLPDNFLASVDKTLVLVGQDLVADYLFTQETPGVSGKTEKSAKVSRRDDNDYFLVVMTSPASEKGKAYLKTDDGMWVMEKGRSTKTDPGNKFQGLNMTNADFRHSDLAHQYRVESSERGVLGKYQCWIVNLVAATADAPYAKRRIWVSDDGLLRKCEDQSDATLLRISYYPSYQKIGTKWVPRQIVFEDRLKGGTVNGKFVGEQTTITISNAQIVKLPASTYTLAYLETASKGP